MCAASNNTDEVDDKGNPVWQMLRRRKRYLFAFADIDTASKTQAVKLMTTINEYTEDIKDVAFTFKRVGNGKDTSYSLNPIIKLKEGDQGKYTAFNDKTVEVEFFEMCLQARTRSK